jgi:hypothetical protein
MGRHLSPDISQRGYTMPDTNINEQDTQATSAATTEVMIGNRRVSFTGDPAKKFKSYSDKATAIGSFKRKVTYYSKRNEPIPTLTHGLSTQECLDLLAQWGIDVGEVETV